MPDPRHPAGSVRFARYVALGDSSTEGIDDPDGAGGYRGWSQRLAERINAAQGGGLHYANLAVRGLTTAQIRTRQLDAALAMRPDIATIFCGTNDVTSLRFDARVVASDIEHMQRTLRDGGATVLSFTLPNLTPLMPLARLIAPRIAALNRALVRASGNTGSDPCGLRGLSRGHRPAAVERGPHSRQRRRARPHRRGACPSPPPAGRQR